MASDRVQRRLERLLDQIDEAETSGDWKLVHNLSKDVLELDGENQEATAYLRAAERRLVEASGSEATGVLHFTSGRSNTSPLERVEVIGGHTAGGDLFESIEDLLPGFVLVKQGSLVSLQFPQNMRHVRSRQAIFAEHSEM